MPVVEQDSRRDTTIVKRDAAGLELANVDPAEALAMFDAAIDSSLPCENDREEGTVPMSTERATETSPDEWRRISVLSEVRDPEAGWTRQCVDQWLESTRRWSPSSGWLRNDARRGSQVVIEAVASIADRFRGRPFEVMSRVGAVEFVLEHASVEAKGAADRGLTAPLQAAADLAARSWDLVVPGLGAVVEGFGSAMAFDIPVQFAAEDLRLRLTARDVRVADHGLGAAIALVHAPRIEATPVPTLVTGAIDLFLDLDHATVSTLLARADSRWRAVVRRDGRVGLRRSRSPWSLGLELAATGTGVRVDARRVGIGRIEIALPRRPRVSRSVGLLPTSGGLELTAVDVGPDGALRARLRIEDGLREVVSLDALRELVSLGIPRLSLFDVSRDAPVEEHGS